MYTYKHVNNVCTLIHSVYICRCARSASFNSVDMYNIRQMISKQTNEFSTLSYSNKTSTHIRNVEKKRSN